MEKNRFEWLHRANTLQGLAAALFGTQALASLVQRAWKALNEPFLPPWSDLAFSAAFTLAAAFFWHRAGKAVRSLPAAGDGADPLRSTERDPVLVKLQERNGELNARAEQQQAHIVELESTVRRQNRSIQELESAAALQAERLRSVEAALSTATTRPLLEGEAFDFRINGPLIEGRSSAGLYHARARCTFDAIVANMHAVTTNLRGVRVDGSRLNPPLAFSDCQILSSPVDFARGVSRSIQLAVVVEFESSEKPRVFLWDLKDLCVFVVDGFGSEHRLNVRQGETILPF